MRTEQRERRFKDGANQTQVQEARSNTVFPVEQLYIGIRRVLKENQNILPLVLYSIGVWAACVFTGSDFVSGGWRR